MSDITQLLDDNINQYFHTINSKFILLSKRYRTEILEALVLLTAILKVPDKYDYNKLVWVVNYLRGYQKFPLP